MTRARSAAIVSGASVKALTSPVLDAHCFHSRRVNFETQHCHNFLEVFVAAVYQDLYKMTITSLYLASIFRMVFRQSPGLLVPYPKTLFFWLCESL